MSDRTAAYLFAEIFGLIGEFVPEAKRKKLALKFWRMSTEYDFDPYQMGCDDGLRDLGLARPVTNEEGDEGMEYGPEGES